MTARAKLPADAAAIDSWRSHAILGEDRSEKIPLLLQREIPPLLSWIVRGGCAVQCQHCIFPFEGPKGQLEQPSVETMLSMLRQLTGGAKARTRFQQLCGPRTLVHEGRQLLKSQVPVLAAIKQAGFGVSLINNGTYTQPALLSLCEREGLAVDALDVSVDGTPAIHNAQRSSKQAWTWAMDGMKHARRILTPTGKLTSLYTLTSLNYSCVRETAETVMPLVDEWHLTTMSLRPGLEHMRASKRALDSALEQLLSVRKEKPVFLRTYSTPDFVWLLEILGKETARKALMKARVTYNAIVLDIGVPLYFYPKSLQVNETLAVDADSWWRLPFCIHHRLDELQAGVDQMGQDISHFNVAPVSQELDVSSRYVEAAKTWWKAIGRDCLNAERATVQRFLTGKLNGRKERSQGNEKAVA